MSLHLALAGLAVGFLIGLSGVGSGALMAPVLLFLGVPPESVVGSDLAFGLFTKSAGVGLHVRRQSVRWPWVGRMAAGSLPGALLGTFLVASLAGSPATIKRWIATMLVVAPLAAVSAELARRRGARWVERLQRPRPWVVSLIGFVIGIAVGATSVGSGSLIDIALILFSPLAAAEIVGTGIAHAILLSGVASAAHWSFGSVNPPLVTNLLVGSVPGVLLGSRLACRAPSRSLRWSVTALVLLSGLTMIRRATL